MTYATKLVTTTMAALALAASACSQIGPATIQQARFDYNDAIVRSFDHQMLLNLVRLRYQDSIFFLDLTSVVASYSRGVSVGASSGGEILQPAVSVAATAGATWTESPTISYSPLQGEDFARRLLAPIQPSAILLLSRSGWGLERLLLCTVQQLNELPNGTAIGGVAPIRVLHFEQFQRAAHLLQSLQENGYIELNTLAGQPETVAVTAGPIRLEGEAREQAKEVLALLRIDVGGARPPSAEPAATPLTAEPPRSSSVGTDGAAEAIPASAAPRGVPEVPIGGPTPVTVEAARFPRNAANLAVRGRSILGVLTFLAQHVDVPDDHVRQGLVRLARGPDGKPFDWSRLSGNLFRVRCSHEAPTRAFLQVQYRGYWFYIDDADPETKSTYTLLAEIFSLQAANGAAQAPVLTIPTR